MQILTIYSQFFSSNILLRLESPGQSVAPYCPITVKSTREIAGFNGLAEALLRLDFIRAVSDIRRFHYVSHLMFLLVSFFLLHKCFPMFFKFFFPVCPWQIKPTTWGSSKGFISNARGDGKHSLQIQHQRTCVQEAYGWTPDHHDHIQSLGQSSRIIPIVQAAFGVP